MGDGSLGYASRLSFKADYGGQLGSPELLDSQAEGDLKVRELARLISSASHVVSAYTVKGHEGLAIPPHCPAGILVEF